MMDKKEAINWAIHHMVVDYYHKLTGSVRKNITTRGLRFEDFLPVAQERVRALLPTIIKEKMSCLDEADKLLSWKCREQAEVEIILTARKFNG